MNVFTIVGIKLKKKMEANKQTAVEWLSKELDEFLFLFDDDWQRLNNLIESAKEMEREQLIQFYEDGIYSVNYPFGLTGEAYYEQEYGIKK